MTPPFYKTAAADAAVVQLLGSPPRIYPWGENTDDPVVYPYVTFRVISGTPGNLLAGRPNHDETTLQIDVWAKTGPSAEAVAQAIERAIELKCRITARRGQSKDPDTGSYREGFDTRWITHRT